MQYLLERAYSNAWRVLSGQTTFDMMMQSQFDKGVELIMPYDPKHGPKKEELEKHDSILHRVRRI